MPSKESLYPRRLYEATLSWRGVASLLDAVGMEWVMLCQLVCVNAKNLPQVVMSGIAGVKMNEFVMNISCKIM